MFASNTPGSLAAIAKIFQDNEVKILAFCIVKEQNFGVVRAIVDKPGATFAAFEKKNGIISLNRKSSSNR
ncbi:MAG: hypothetical protein LBU24_00200 [Methanocalculaceae archaeon]|nr:hypothetical protein [Methanocalculaceae archaeon]